MLSSKIDEGIMRKQAAPNSVAVARDSFNRKFTDVSRSGSPVLQAPPQANLVFAFSTEPPVLFCKAELTRTVQAAKSSGYSVSYVYFSVNSSSLLMQQSLRFVFARSFLDTGYVCRAIETLVE